MSVSPKDVMRYMFCCGSGVMLTGMCVGVTERCDAMGVMTTAIVHIFFHCCGCGQLRSNAPHLCCVSVDDTIGMSSIISALHVSDRKFCCCRGLMSMAGCSFTMFE